MSMTAILAMINSISKTSIYTANINLYMKKLSDIHTVTTGLYSLHRLDENLFANEWGGICNGVRNHNEMVAACQGCVG